MIDPSSGCENRTRFPSSSTISADIASSSPSAAIPAAAATRDIVKRWVRERRDDESGAPCSRRHLLEPGRDELAKVLRDRKRLAQRRHEPTPL
jgi:hypothetical protein